MNKKEQIQLYFRWPDRGFEIDAIRVVGIDLFEWDALFQFISANKRRFPILATFVHNFRNISAPRKDLPGMMKECDEQIDFEKLDQPEMSALATLSMFISQALEQRDASISMAYHEGEYFEMQSFIMSGTDLLKDLEEINSRKMA